jgi:5'-nucleotidase
MENIIISDKKRLEELKNKISKKGKEGFHVLADFDRTLTKTFVNGQKSSTVIAQIRNGNYISNEYSMGAHKLFDIYHPIEIDPNIGYEEKNSKMMEWWKKHFELLFKCGLNMQVMKEIVSKKKLKFREKTLEFIYFLYENNVPLIIMSAGPGDMIKMYLEEEGRLYESIHIIANMFKFDENGKAIELNGKIIHSLNKDEAEIKGLLIYNELRKRENVLLLGDSIEDIKMIKGFKYNNLIKVGFLNENIEENLEEFKKNFDVIILNDGSMEYVDNLVREIFNHN